MSKIGIANYSLHPLNLMPHQVLQWAHDNGAAGVLFSDMTYEVRDRLTVSYLHDLGRMARDLNMYIEWGNAHHIPFNLSDWSKVDLMPLNMKAVGEAVAAGATIVRSCSEGMVRANPSNPTTAQLMKATIAEIKRMIPMLRDNGVTLAIETHFEFTTFELLKIFDKCNIGPGDCIGICLDTMNLLTMLENPVQAAERLMPWVVCTHIKDGGLVFDRDGMTAFPSPLGSGIIELEKIVAMLLDQKRGINLSTEGHGGSYLLPVHEPWFISQFPDLTISEYNNLMLLEDKAEELMMSGKLFITTEEEWTSVCEARTRSDLKKLQEILQKCS